MGGGDLNLKKSWHPSTMKNMEKVWKAEQQKHEEKRRIAELKKEIEMEKDREDITKYAMEQGVIEKKDDKKLDWMYQGPNQMVNREDYLLGKPIDKSFEQLAQAEKDAELNRAPKNHVEHECIPPSLRFFSGNEQVDLARKMQEDPLYAIKKKEMETRSQLLKNPVKLKQLRQLLEQQTKKEKKSEKKKKKKKHKHDSDDSDEESKLDMLLANKYKQLKDKINEKDLIKSMKKSNHKRKKKLKKREDSESDASSSSDESSTDEDSKKRKKKDKKQDKGKCLEKNDRRESFKHDVTEKQFRDRSLSKERRRSSSRDRMNRSQRGDRTHRRNSNDRSRSPRYGEHFGNTSSKNRYNSKAEHDDKYLPNKSYGLQVTNSMRSSSSYNKHASNSSTKSHSAAFERSEKDNKDKEKWNSKRKTQLSEVEKEQRRQEMMANATWRDKEREKNVKLYRQDEQIELNSTKTYNRDFIRKQLAVAAEVGTVASRIKSNINNIQRSGRAMDTNFAKR